MPHTHEVEHWPAAGTGWGVCSCGATIRVQDGKMTGAWHACPLCVLGLNNQREGLTRCGCD